MAAAARIPLHLKLLKGITRRLDRLGLHVEPFLVVREGGVDAMPVGQPSWRGGFLEAADIGELMRLEPGKTARQIEARIASGHLCFGIKVGSRVIAKMWCDLDEFNYLPNRRLLSSDEVYLYGAFADPEFRGQGLAPYMRAMCYEALRVRGRTRFISYTHYFNHSARRFKAKLGAQNECLRVHVSWGAGSGRTWTIRTYPA